LRAVATLTAAAAIVAGCRNLKATNALTTPWNFRYAEPWQVLNAVTYLLNFAAVRVPGRLDGRQWSQDAATQQRYFAPAGWAFAIWAPIFAGELLFVIYQALPLARVRTSWWLAELSPYFSGAMLLQTLWCGAFRPWARAAGLNLQWIPALLLGLGAAALGGAHGILVQALEDSELSPLSYALAFVPLALHFGWLTAAALVNANGFVAAAAPRSHAVKASAAIASIYLAVLVGAAVTFARRDPIYAAVIAWALAAIADEAAWGKLRGQVDETVLQIQRLTAKGGSRAMLAVAAAPLAAQALRVGGALLRR
ncbi:hypothetical protein JKP88DRAFT_300907, partial [Tribonema minus]